jgi:hypothetical protein
LLDRLQKAIELGLLELQNPSPTNSFLASVGSVHDGSGDRGSTPFVATIATSSPVAAGIFYGCCIKR